MTQRSGETQRDPNLIRRAKSRVKQTIRARRRAPAAETAGHSTVRFCPFCGAVLGSSFSDGDNCPACERQVAWVSPGPVQVRSRALEETILAYSKLGYYVIRQKEDFAEMRKPKRFSKAWAAAWFVAGIPLMGPAVLFPVGYAAWHVLQKERALMLVVNEDGTVGVVDITAQA